MRHAGLVLAAGDSTRMGAPKALLRQEGVAAVARLLTIAHEAGCDPVVVVLGRHATRIRDAVDLSRAVVVENPDPDAGRTGSLKRGLAAARDADAVLVWPVDHPGVSPRTVRALLAAHAGGVTVPAHDGRRGHPLVLDAAVAREVAALADDAPLRDVVRRDPGRVRVVDVADAAVRANLDTPADAAAWGWALPGA